MSITKKTLAALSFVALMFAAPGAAMASSAQSAPIPGYGSKMYVQNLSETAKVAVVEKVQCMYDDGEQGSNLSLFNGRYQPGDRIPNQGGQYIEQKNSGSCFFESSYFTLRVIGVGSVDFKGTNSGWSVENNSNPDKLSVSISDTGQGWEYIGVKML
ncbi:hypothetical protein ACOQFL_17035 [Actinopolyspora sp. H202]|uniref:hypothetical protein n=1 Tax=Actinopolyspora sp. H202 TaxID=1500456 RepID=UPI003EE75239